MAGFRLEIWLDFVWKFGAYGLQPAEFPFEVGGKAKKHKQIQGIEHAYLVKDDIEHWFRNEIPLWAFGLLY